MSAHYERLTAVALGFRHFGLLFRLHQSRPCFHQSIRRVSADVELQDGSKIIGKNGDDNFQFRSDVLGEMKLPLERIRSIACQPKTNSVQLATVNGDTLTAQFVTKVVRVETAFGSVKLPVNLIRRLTVLPAGKPGQMREGLVALWPGKAMPMTLLALIMGWWMEHWVLRPAKWDRLFC